MKPTFVLLSVLGGAGLVGLPGCSDDPGQLIHEIGEDRGFTELQLRGEALYQRYCVGCHGVDGDGKGLAAAFLDPKPRDFTRGSYKFRTTPSGSLPTDDDLMRTLREGVHGTSMSNWEILPREQRKALIAYIKTYSPMFERRQPAPSIAIPGAPKDLMTSERIAQGKALYLEQQCHRCHGETGKGDGTAAATLVDSWGDSIEPFDFTRRAPKGGAEPEDLYRTFMTGMSGTPMPSFADTTENDEQRWAIVAYVLSLREISP